MRVAYQAAHVGQIWQKKEKCPSSEDVSHSGLWPNVAREWCPWSVIRRTCHAADIGQMWQKNDAPFWRTLSHCGLWPNAVQIVPLVGGLCHAADFNQMWLKLCPSSGDFVTQRTLTKYGPKCAPHWRTLSHCRLWPDVVQICAPCQGLCHAADFDQMWSNHVPIDGRLCFAMEFDQIWMDNVLIIKDSQYQTNRS